jgi:hypothetical protein
MPFPELILSVLGVTFKATSTAASCYNYYDRHRYATYTKVIDHAPSVVGGIEGVDWYVEPVYYRSASDTCEAALARGKIVHWVRLAGSRSTYQPGEKRPVRFDYRFNGKGCIAWMTVE